ncbi:hypothetical protein PK35_05595 [Tamlana nanhaiensis]|uniref:Lipocalin-like domain-containing protein n=1 Tax=Neotamlana nanhaiensis TaxID=1382798 RepID=A0A0D7W6B0_9FLAO|nr:hypothetical protein [Tamlana nanhaiensis]KJD33332.1 hypothetical protein PK35_05595 [Tamlana nanhaiensis]
MKILSKLYLILCCFVCLCACHKDNDDTLTSDSLLGVWEFQKEEGSTQYTFQLVLAPNSRAGENVRYKYSSGEVTSSFNERHWNKVDSNTIEIEESTTSVSYQLTSDNHLVSNTDATLVLIKISENYGLYLAE